MKHRGGGGSGSGTNGYGFGGGGGNDMVLPLTMSDLSGTSTTAATTTHRGSASIISSSSVGGAGSTAIRIRRVRKKKSRGAASGINGNNMWGFGTLLFFILAAGLLTAFVQRHAIVQNYGITSVVTTGSSRKNSGGDDALRETMQRFVQQEQKTNSNNLPFKDFPSLQYALHHSDLVLLYFAASWCPMSTPITKLVDELFSPLLLPPPSGNDDEVIDKMRDLEQHQLQGQEEKLRHGKISLVYVSSDSTKEDMEKYKKRNWRVVPFISVDDERAKIKRHFQTCAKREMDKLHMTTRQHEIPTIIVLSGGSGGSGNTFQQEPQVLTFHGIKDIQHALAVSEAENDSQETTKEEAAKFVIDSWMELRRLSNSLSEKFDNE